MDNQLSLAVYRSQKISIKPSNHGWNLKYAKIGEFLSIVGLKIQFGVNQSLSKTNKINLSANIFGLGIKNNKSAHFKIVPFLKAWSLFFFNF